MVDFHGIFGRPGRGNARADGPSQLMEGVKALLEEYGAHFVPAPTASGMVTTTLDRSRHALEQAALTFLIRHPKVGGPTLVALWTRAAVRQLRATLRRRAALPDALPPARGVARFRRRLRDASRALDDILQAEPARAQAVATDAVRVVRHAATEFRTVTAAPLPEDLALGVWSDLLVRELIHSAELFDVVGAQQGIALPIAADDARLWRLPRLASAAHAERIRARLEEHAGDPDAPARAPEGWSVVEGLAHDVRAAFFRAHPVVPVPGLDVVWTMACLEAYEAAATVMEAGGWGPVHRMSEMSTRLWTWGLRALPTWAHRLRRCAGGIVHDARTRLFERADLSLPPDLMWDLWLFVLCEATRDAGEPAS